MYPINPATLIFGGIFNNICMWSGQISASSICTSFHWHNCLCIFPISVFLSLYSICLRYFGANTIWYLQFQLVCANLSMSLSIVRTSLCFKLPADTGNLILAQGVFLSFSPVNLFFYHRHSRWFFIPMKNPAHKERGFLLKIYFIWRLTANVRLFLGSTGPRYFARPLRIRIYKYRAQ